MHSPRTILIAGIAIIATASLAGNLVGRGVFGANADCVEGGVAITNSVDKTSEKSVGGISNYPLGPNDIYTKKELPPIISTNTSSLVVDFPICNSSDRAVKFVSIQKSCSCAEATLDKMAIGVGEETQLKMSLHLPGRYGLQRVVCTVTDEAGRNWICDMSTTVYREADFEPSVTHFGMVKPNTQHDRSIVLLFAATKSESLPSAFAIACETSCVKWDLHSESIQKIRDGLYVKHVRYAIRLKTPEAYGTGSCQFSVNYTASDGRKETKSTTLDWHCVESYVPSPRQVFFSTRHTQKNDGQMKLVVLRRRDGSSFENFTIISPHVCLTLGTKKNGSSLEIEVRFDPAKSDVFREGEIVVNTDDPDQPFVKIPIAIDRE